MTNEEVVLAAMAERDARDRRIESGEFGGSFFPGHWRHVSEVTGNFDPAVWEVFALLIESEDHDGLLGSSDRALGAFFRLQVEAECERVNEIVKAEEMKIAEEMSHG